MAVKVVNIEQGLPTAQEAVLKLKLQLSTFKKTGTKHVKIIHGYGSTGKGGAIKIATRRYLQDQLQTRRIKAFCPGEQFGPFAARGRDILAMAPQLRQDRDWGRENDGITIVIL